MIGGLLLLFVGLSLLIDACLSRPIVGMPPAAWRKPVGCGMAVLGLVLLAGVAAAAVPTPRASVARVTVPDASAMYRRWVEQAVGEEWGVDGSPARLAAQLHQESSWNPKARSAVGAQGLAQFMPATARWIAQAFPAKLGDFDPWDPQQAALAAAVYDAWLVKRNPGTSACSTWAFALSAYNGGERALRVEQTRAGRHAGIWFGNVAEQRARSTVAWQENRAYVRRILLTLEPAYIAAGWSGQAVCA